MNARLIAFLLVLGLTQVAQPQPATPLPGTPEAVDAFVLAEMARQHIPGLSLAVIRAGKVVKAKGSGFSDLELREPVTPDTADPISHAYLPKVVSLAAADLEQFVGAYDVQLEDNRVLTFRVFTRDEQLFSQVEGRPEIPLRYLGGSEFGADIDWSRRVTFIKDGGVVTGMAFTTSSANSRPAASTSCSAPRLSGRR